jgi:hypothetical protein
MRTVMGIPGMYRENAAAQMNAPFQTANEIAGLQKTQAQIEAERANTDYLKAHAEYFRNSDQREKHAHPIVNPVTGQVLSEDPDSPGHWKLDPSLQESPRPQPPVQREFGLRDLVNMKNAERAAQGLPPLDSDGALGVIRAFNASKEGGKQDSRPPRLDPTVKARIGELDKTISQLQADYSKMPTDPIKQMILKHNDENEYNRLMGVQDSLTKARAERDAMINRYLPLSDDGDNSDIPQPIAPVRVPGVTPMPGTQLVQGPPDSKGRPTLQQIPMPGTSKPSPKKKDTLGIL